MSHIKQKVETFLGMLENPNPESLAMSLNDVHSDGLFSLVIDGTEPGNLTRVFYATKKLNPFDVQLHTHRYGINITVIKGQFKHHLAEIYPKSILPDALMSMFEYKSFLLGGNGLTFKEDVSVRLTEKLIPEGSLLSLANTEFHTVSCKKGAIWVVEECGFESETSLVLGVPFIADSLYNKPEMFQINDVAQKVAAQLKKLIEAFKSVK